MRTLKNCIIAFVLLSIVVACKDEKQKEVSTQQQATPEAPVQVVVDMVVKKDDVFEIFYTEDESLDFIPDHKIRVNVTGKNESQQIVFNLPDNLHIGNLRFDVGQNQEQPAMTVNGFIIKQHDKELALSAADFFTHFQPTGYIKADPKNFSFTCVKENGVYDPFLYGNTTLMQALRQFNK